ncbi:zinc-ribbon domain-containing protein [Actinocorallia sp. API 0066]|uniref:zinc-ribbon domain-containing protein n=1 Tax=Actinocorallia sp. API 0066 TaxID=2896846 RepID=UPI001E399AFD|nr:zinc-ribbon domain-containing protein [Actinocorallia sp. API 0066]MCD0453526.1 zinc-ribbon domain-containing protein [Actinocorallia sp. API 0066]
MVVLLGVSVCFRTVGEGMFHCPSCGGDRRYRRRAGRRYVSVFFLPVIPLARLGQTVECRSCRTRFNTGALRTPTAARMEAALPAAARAACCLALAAGDPTSTAARIRAVDVVRGYGEDAYGPDELVGDLEMPESFHREEIATTGAQLAVEAKEWFLAQVVRVALASGDPLSGTQRDALHRVAEALGMSHAHALGVILTTTEGASR